MNRRRFLKAVSAAGAVGLAGRALYLGKWETWALRVVEVDVPLPNLPAAFDGLRIALLSDLHIGPHVSAEYISRALRLGLEQEADLLILAGDYVSQDWHYLEAVTDALGQLAAPLGVLATLGNHDFFANRLEPIVRMLEAARIRVLRNEAVEISQAGESLWLVGIDDPVTEHQDFAKALRGVPASSCRIFLAHTPDVVATVSQLGGGLLLAGHTHGGQIDLPFVGPPAVPSKYGQRFAAGLAQYESTAVYVTRGVGVVEPYLRFRCPPEIAVLTLCRADWPLTAGGPERDMRSHVRKARHGMRVLKRLKRTLQGKENQPLSRGAGVSPAIERVAPRQARRLPHVTYAAF